MLEAVATGILPLRFQFRQQNRLLGELATSFWRGNGQLELEEGTYELYREGWFSGDFLLELDGKVVARASKPSAFQNRFEVEMPNRRVVLHKPSSYNRLVILLDGEKQIGSIYPLGVFTRRTGIDLPDDWPLPIRVFLFWIVFTIWKRPNQVDVT